MRRWRARGSPFEPGLTKIAPLHGRARVRRAGIYNVKANLRRVNEPLATATARLTVRPELGDRTLEQP